MTDRLKVAVIFGGSSPEHDVSIGTGLEALQAVDGERFEAFPVYIATDGQWLVGKELRERGAFLPGPAERERLLHVSGPWRAPGGRPVLRALGGGLLRRPADVELDVALLALHGGGGEDGSIQGLFEMMRVPYTGMRVMGAAVAMDKVATKQILADAGIPLLPHVELRRPGDARLLPRDVLQAAIDTVGLPAIVKPTHLGSSIGVQRVASLEELETALPAIFKLDRVAILEKFVANLAEYNIAVAAFDSAPRASAIERPKREADAVLDFRQKYRAQPGKLPGQRSEATLAISREVNPVIPSGLEAEIRRAALLCFERLGGAGAPRIDFLCDTETGEIWLSEVNPCPGLLAYNLWQAASPPLLFTPMLSALIDEALRLHRGSQLAADPVPVDARIFRRP
jgi:D-alanine-D-alanine ligase